LKLANIGTIIQGKYEILKLIGKGGMSRVYLAMDQNLNKQWAVKEIEKRAMDKNNEVVIQSAMAEANMMKKLDHPSLPRIVDIIDKEDVIYVVMDYIEGEPLSSVLNKYGAQPQETVLQWAKELCQVLDYLHTQDPPIIYRDMKPANVMLQPNGNVKLIDFGIAREYKEKNLADTVSLGTKGYAAPEQFGGKGQTDARTDVYCLGVTLYHLLTGKNPCEPPYEIYPIRYWNPQLSSGLESIILKCTQLNPEDRYQSCAELLYALEHYDEMDESYRRKQKKKLGWFIGVTAASLVGFIVGIGSQGLKVYANNSDYDNNILQAEKSATEEEKIEYYSAAIDIKPGSTQAYLGMVEAFKDDAVFSVDEEELFKKKVNSNLSSLQNNKDYADLAFEIGKLYWYYYDYGRSEDSDNQVTRMKSSIQWFEDACTYGGEDSDYYTMASMYRDIGQFNRDITLNIEEASDKGTYLPYWINLTELVATVNTGTNESEIVNLEVYKLALNSIETYARKFKADEVTEEDMTTLLNAIELGANGTDTTTDKTEEMKEEVMSRIDAAQTAIENAYAGSQEVGS
jgi:serine/threonine-protein kinase